VNPYGHIVGSGIGAGNSAELQAQKKGVFVRVTHPFYSLPSLANLAANQAGLFYSQSFPAMLVAPIRDPKPGETIVDFCAAPGGKTTHFAQLTNNQCRVFAVDRSEGRLSRLKEEAKRLGVTCVETFAGRANEFCAQHPDFSADRIIVDPPCTALGVRPKLFDLTTFARIRSTASYQRMILDSAIETLRPGGFLVYSTCTLTVEENEHNIQYLIDSKGFKIERQTPFLGDGGIEGRHPLRQGVQRFYPDLHNLPGYFIAKLRKPSKSGS
jgi:16S rRNA C967 or C1407 C5-methylase (RsmB/RsmF family)